MKTKMKIPVLALMFCVLFSNPMMATPLMAEGAPSAGMERSQPDLPPSMPKNDLNKMDELYLLQVGDRVKITIYPEDEYLKGGEMEVSSEGNITLPLVGKVGVAGKNVIAAEKAIAAIVGADYLVDPEVVIEVLRYKEHSVIILGQVKKPGTYPFPEGSTRLTLLQAIALAGGFSDIANIKKIKVVRSVDGKTKSIHANAQAIISGNQQDIELESGDVIHVMESLF